LGIDIGCGCDKILVFRDYSYFGEKMKLADRTVEIHSKGLESANSFSIAQTSKMFKILSDSLYSDKVMAVIRELSTNAYDAHIAAGNKNPFKVTLPTQSNPSFTVRDYGTGLSQHDMEELYTTYGASNKNNSNDFVGCLGLGSKSPFAYTKSFSTTSYYNGKAYCYIAAMDENGVPTLNLFNIADTNEPNGLEISFAVKQYDFAEFANKSKRIFHYFKMKPIIEGSIDATLNDHSYSYNNVVMQGTDWKIGRISNNTNHYPSSYNSPNSGVVAIMGNIAYPVDVNKIIGDEKEDTTNDNIQKWNRAFKKADVDNWKSLVKEIINANLYLEIQFNIGQLEMDVSREGLQYTKQVIKTLREKTQEIYFTLKNDMSEKLKEATSLVEAYTTYYSLSDIAGGWTAGASWTDPNGKVHELSSGHDIEYKFSKNKHFYAINFRGAGYRSRRLVYLTDKIHQETLSGKGHYYWQNQTKNGKLAFFRCDVKTEETAKKVVLKYCNNNNCFAYLMVDSTHPEDSTSGFDDVINDIGGEQNVLNVSDYKDLIKNNSPRTHRNSTGKISSDEIFILSSSKDSDSTLVLSGNPINDAFYLRELSGTMMNSLEDCGQIVYIPIVRYASVESYPSILSIYGMMSTNDHVFHSLFKDTNIYAIKQSAVDKLKKSGYNLVDFNTWFKPQAKNMITSISTEISSYRTIIEYCTDQYNTESKSNSAYYNHYKFVDRNIMVVFMEIFGINYREYIGDTELCEIIDQWMVIYFFANIMRAEGFNFKFCSKKEFYATMSIILAKYNLNDIDPEKIKTCYAKYGFIKFNMHNLYPNDKTVDLLKSNNDPALDKIMSMKDLRKQLEACIDKVPVLKYTVGMGIDRGYSDLMQTNSDPLKSKSDSYYGLPSWLCSIKDNITELRTDLATFIK
jgi:hypothetical protein